MTQPSISAPLAGAPKQQVCPQCQAPIPANPDFVSWCDQCNWNLKLDQLPQPKSAIEAFYLKLSQRLSRELFETMAADPVARPRPVTSTVLALGVAALVQLSTVLLAVLGLVLLAQDWPNLVLIALGLLCLGIAWVLRPQLGKLPSDIAPPQDFPTLYAISNRIAVMLGALEKLHYTGTFLHTVQRLAVGRGGDAPRELVPALRQRVAALPEHEIERLRRLELLDSSRLDTTHPPTAYRVRYLQAHATAEPAVRLSDEEAARLERELLSLQPRLQRELVDQYRNQL